MRHPHRARRNALLFLAGGVVAASAAFVLPEAVAGDTTKSLLFIGGVTALLFGGGTALFRHFDARAKDALARGEAIIARWHVDAATWRAFIAQNEQLHQDRRGLSNELLIRDGGSGDGVEVIVGDTAVEIDGSIHVLPRRGTPEITHAELKTGGTGPAFVELRLYYPRGGYGASGVPQSARRTALRFPVTSGARRDAERVVAHYASGRPGKADFFHGTGDGTDPEDASECLRCGYLTHTLVSHCPRCGAGMQSRRWSRRFGIALVVCGLFITGVMGAVLYYTAPLLLQPGVRVGDTQFSGSAGQGWTILGIMGLVTTVGVAAMLYGAWQASTGRRGM